MVISVVIGVAWFYVENGNATGWSPYAKFGEAGLLLVLLGFIIVSLNDC